MPIAWYVAQTRAGTIVVAKCDPEKRKASWKMAWGPFSDKATAMRYTLPVKNLMAAQKNLRAPHKPGPYAQRKLSRVAAEVHRTTKRPGLDRNPPLERWQRDRLAWFAEQAYDATGGPQPRWAALLSDLPATDPFWKAGSIKAAVKRLKDSERWLIAKPRGAQFSDWYDRYKRGEVSQNPYQAAKYWHVSMRRSAPPKGTKVRTVSFGPDILARMDYVKRTRSKLWQVRSLLFPKAKFTAAEALAWTRAHKYRPWGIEG